jgi:DNA-binding NarL/FixJ family response regulator
MVNYREIIRLKSQGYSNTSVATSTRSSRNTVAEVWQLTQEKDIQWQETS